MNRLTRNISIILRSERLIARRHLTVLRRQTGMMIAAGIAAAIALVMLNASAYLALSSSVTAPIAALLVALANIAITITLVLFASKPAAHTDEIAAVEEVRDMAMEDIEAELRAFTDEAKATTQAVKKIARDPLGSIAPGIAGTIAKSVIKNMKD
ncbi:hypothetical protein [Kordiimonas sp. SCSIO 12610]|uniref:hypothetical protein n=1 Tax=Kordiimonas sp. SCSIO 12610 TaxID=2829597 RepID=UPI00210BCA5B|nr:hypothetical protein [Kordiimonas sp. SCSIO 12610]UTW56496.1 hypothetical protein KFF44_06235 [Kordiimonas sp. SCSIO 12610]